MSVEKNVPEIRFKGFSGDWVEYPLSAFISSLDAGVSVNSGDRSANENEFGILKTSCVTNGFFEPNENKIVLKLDEISRLKEPVLEDTIIISRMNTPALVGANAYISRSYANYFLPDRLWAAKPTSSGNLKFLSYILGSYKGHLALSDLATGTSGSMKNISKPSVLRLIFRVPRDPEQTAIGNTFQKLDSLINQHQQKHDKLSNIKKAMLKKMFPKQSETIPEIRFKGFSGEWEERVLEDICDVRDGTHASPQYQQKGFPLVTSKNVKNGYINYDDVQFISKTDFDEINIRSKVDVNDILMGMIGTIGNIALIRETPDFAIKNVALIKDKNLIDFLYSYYFFQSPNTTQQLEDCASGGTQKFISLSNVRSLLICLPEKEEQTAIGNYFQKLDALINQHQQQITKLNNIKQACLSKMFV